MKARANYTFSELLTLDEKDPKRLFEGNALIRRLVRIGVLDESRMKLDYVLALRVEDFLERRLQTCVYKLGLAKSIHHARVLIKQRHIRYAGILEDDCWLEITNEYEIVSASRSSTSPPTWSASTPRSTSTSLSPLPSVVAAPVVSSARRLLLLLAVVMTRPRRTRSRLLKIGVWTGFVTDNISAGLQCHCSIAYNVIRPCILTNSKILNLASLRLSFETQSFILDLSSYQITVALIVLYTADLNQARTPNPDPGCQSS